MCQGAWPCPPHMLKASCAPDSEPRDNAPAEGRTPVEETEDSSDKRVMGSLLTTLEQRTQAWPTIQMQPEAFLLGTGGVKATGHP